MKVLLTKNGRLATGNNTEINHRSRFNAPTFGNKLFRRFDVQSCVIVLKIITENLKYFNPLH